MNKESRQILTFIHDSNHYLDKIARLRVKYPNIKDFQNQFGYLIMEIVNENKQFIHINRTNIDLPAMTTEYFSG